MRNAVEVKRRALELGFDAVGIATLEPNGHADELDRWLAAGYAATMRYLHRQAGRRKRPSLIMPEARVAVVTLVNYFHGWTDPGNPGLAPGVGGGSDPRRKPGAPGRVAQYALSADYHRLLGPRLERLAKAIDEVVPGANTRCYVDAGPVPERELAQRAGLGWIGKNMMLINPALGSFTFIGVVLTDADLTPDPPFETDRCGTCRACLDACPTDAFVAPHVLDAGRCISYLTIEHRGAFSDAEGRMLGDWAFGCDVCQDVCPWNVKFARPTADPDWAVRPDLAKLDLAALLDGDAADFERRFGDTALTRPGFAGMRRNAAAVLENEESARP